MQISPHRNRKALMRRGGGMGMKIAERVKWVSRDVKSALIDLDFSMLPYQEDAWPFCQKHPSDVSSEADLSELGCEVRAYLLADTSLQRDDETP